MTGLKNKALENEKPFVLNENNKDVLQPRPYLQRPNYASAKGSTEYVYSGVPKAYEEAAFTNQDLKINTPEVKIPTLDMPETKVKIVSSDSVKAPLKDRVTNAFDTVYRRFVDNYSPIKNTNEDTYIKAINSKNVGGTVDYILKDGLTDINGKTIGKSLKEVAQDIPNTNDFWEYMLHKNNVGRAAQGKNVFPEFDSAQSAAKALQIEQLHPEYKQAAQNVRNFLDTFMEKWGKDTGLISDDLYNNLRQMYPDYIPTNRAFDEIEKNVVNFGKRGFVDQSSPLKKATGSCLY
jgi:hypothetical protein